MKPVVLIAGNYLREQRWFLVFLVAYAMLVFGGLGAAVGRGHSDDLMELFWQQAGYAVFFSLFLAATAVHNDRKTRRILSVLSKGVTRGQYLAGMLLGVTGAIGVYYASIGVVALWMLRDAMPAGRLLEALGLLGLACLLVSAVTLFFSTFLPPLAAMVATSAVVGVSTVLRSFSVFADLLPVYSLMQGVFAGPRGHLSWEIPLLGVVDVVLLWILAGWVFARRDIAVAVE